MKSHTAPLVPTSPSPTVLWVPGDARAELGWEADWVVAYLPCVPESGQAPTCDCPRADAHPSGSGMPTGGDAQSGASVPRCRGGSKLTILPWLPRVALERKGSGRPRMDVQSFPTSRR